VNIPNLHSLCKKRSFALAEVCVAITVVGIATAYIFSSMQESIHKYATLRDEICCNELADEHFARAIARFLTDPADFDTTTAENGSFSSIEEGPYTVSLQTTCTLQSKKKGEAATTEKEPVALVSLKITSGRGPRGEIAEREVKLCVCKEGT
jgi:type II secretory pathway pseudopilin PulG